MNTTTLSGTPDTTTNALPTWRVLLMAAAAGLSVASAYYSQPLLGVLAPALNADPAWVGALPTLTQLGYGLGIGLLAPLGDRVDRRRLIVVKALLLALALLVSAMATGLGGLIAASLVIGLVATMAQDVVPAAASLAPDARRGQVVGTVMTGLLLGILLSRVVSGVVAQQFGWRSVYALGALSMALVALATWRGLPRFQPTTSLSYGALLASLAPLWRRHEALRRATYAQGLLSLGFSAFWSTLAVMLHHDHGIGSAVAGAFGLAGAAGALAAPLAGRLADRHGPERVIRAGAVLAALSFAFMLAGRLWLPQAPLAWPMGVLVVGAIGFDLGLQAALIAHQTQVYGVEPAARSRLTAVLITGMFIGMAIGSALAALLLAQVGWEAVLALGMLASLGAVWLRLHRAEVVQVA